MITAVLLGMASWLVVAMAGPRLAHRLPPALATRLLVVAAAAVAASMLVIAGLVGLTWFARLPEVIELGPWSGVALRADSPVPVVVAVVAAGTLTATVGSAAGLLARRVRAVWQTRRACRGLRHADGLIVLDQAHPLAFSTPPPAGRIVVTAGLLRGLDPAERRVLLAHESSHIRHGHAWWAIAADLAAAVNPLLIPTARAVHQAVERWADEDAAAAVRDRPLVARTLARSALLMGGARLSAPNLPAATSGVPERVAALLTPAPARRMWAATVLVTLLFGVAGATGVVERHADEFFDQAQLPTAATHFQHHHRHHAEQDPDRGSR